MKSGLLFGLLCAFSLFAGERAFSKGGYKNLIIFNGAVWALTGSGELRIIDLDTWAESGKRIHATGRVKALSAAQSGEPVVVETGGSVKRYDLARNTWEVLGTTNEELYAVFVTGSGDIFTVSSAGITELATKKLWFVKGSNAIGNMSKGWHNVECCYMDQRGRIWIGFGYGEWGGDLIVFNVYSKKFETDSLKQPGSGEPVKSFCEDEAGNVYLSAGLMHFEFYGVITRIDSSLQGHKVLETDTQRQPADSSGKESVITGDYMGPAAYSTASRSLYFYSQNGIQRGRVGQDLSKRESWQTIVKPGLHWTNGQSNAVGSPMNVLKLIAIGDDRLVLLSEEDGIGYYDGKKLRMIND